MRTERSIAEIRAELEAAKSRLAELRVRQKKMEEETYVVKNEIHNLEDGWHRQGIISSLACELQTAELRERDATAQKIRVVSWGEKVEEFVLVKVTSKRVYVRRPGSTDEKALSREPSRGECQKIHPEDLARITEGK